MNEELTLTSRKCKCCEKPLEHRFVDINIPGHREGNNTIEDKLPELEYLLPTYVCAHCFLVQVDESYLPAVRERAYVSSFGSTRLMDTKLFTDNIFERFESTDRSLEVALINRNDVSSKRVRDNTFIFGTNGLHELIDMYGKADSIICHDELAYVHDMNDWVKGLSLFLKSTGVVSMEFRHLLAVLEGYAIIVPASESFPYLSLTTLDKVLDKHGLMVFELGNNPRQGYLKILIKHAADFTKPVSNRVAILRGKERSFGMSSLQCYHAFKDRYQGPVLMKEEFYFLSRH